MRIMAFVQDPVAIKQIMRSLGLPAYTAPPPLPKCSRAEYEQCCLDEILDCGELNRTDYDTFDA